MKMQKDELNLAQKANNLYCDIREAFSWDIDIEDSLPDEWWEAEAYDAVKNAAKLNDLALYVLTYVRDRKSRK